MSAIDYSAERYCDDLPTTPRPEAGCVLVTGATGYIGGRLIPELLGRGYEVRAMVRAPSPEHAERWPGADVVVADASDREALEHAMAGVHTAYYLIHSLLLGRGRFEAEDLSNARNFRLAAERRGVQRIVYLGGLGDVRTVLSPHLRSRAEVAVELASGPIPCTVLRAAIIIGSGSASYEILRNLVKNVPVFAVPSWSRTRCQPIAIRDVIRYLVGVLESPQSSGHAYDIGGRDVLSYEAMMKIQAELLGLKRIFFRSPYNNLRFFAYMAGLLTPVPSPIAISLMEGMKNDVVCEDDAIRRLLPFKPLSYREAIVGAMSREEQDDVHTRWSDAYPPAHELAIHLHEIDPPPRYQTTYSIETAKTDASLFAAVCRIGGKEGWFHSNWMWRLRGVVDRMLAGVGTQRGRRSASELRINDVLDFWRVEDLVRGRRLLLRAEMKLPGRAWLDFVIASSSKGRVLSVTASYDTHTLAGHLYWYALLPMHWYIFGNLLRQIVRRSV